MESTRFDFGWNDTIEAIAACDNLAQLMWFLRSMRTVTKEQTGYGKGCKAAIDVVLGSGKFINLKAVTALMTEKR